MNRKIRDVSVSNLNQFMTQADDQRAALASLADALKRARIIDDDEADAPAALAGLLIDLDRAAADCLQAAKARQRKSALATLQRHASGQVVRDPILGAVNPAEMTPHHALASLQRRATVAKQRRLERAGYRYDPVFGVMRPPKTG